jgi:AmiR/NasT family two-component response regulator
MGEGVARSVLDVLLEQGARLHAADMALEQARRAQQERRRIEQAKWWLVSRHGLTEADAHDRLQRTAMNAGLPLHEVAAQILRDASTSQPRVR